MGVSRNPYSEQSLELRRQSERVREQLTALRTLLKNASDNLEVMEKIMSKTGNTEITNQIKSLSSAISSYDKKANSIYSKLADSLAYHANKSNENLKAFTSKVSSVSKAIEAL